jgi:hypothetical protein
MNKSKYYELEDLIFADLAGKLYQLVHDGSWKLVDEDEQDHLALKLHHHGDEMTFDQVKEWVKIKRLNTPEPFSI